MSNGPLDRLGRAAEEALGDDPRPAIFARGLAIGALVGAAIAGSTIWQRRHARDASVAGTGPPAPDPSAAPVSPAVTDRAASG